MIEFRMEVNPIAVILVHMDSKGDRLLYRYPYQVHHQNLQKQLSTESRKRNLYAISNVDDLQTQPPSILHSSKNYAPLKTQSFMNILLAANNSLNGMNICNCGSSRSHQPQGFGDEVLSTLFAVKQQLCNQKFELKVNDVRFVSHPTLIQKKEQQQQSQLQRVSIVNVLNNNKNLLGNGVNASGPGCSSVGNSVQNQLLANSVSNEDNTLNPNVSSLISASSLPLASSVTGSSQQPVLTTPMNSLNLSGINFAGSHSSSIANATSLTSIAPTSSQNLPSKSQPQQMLISIVFALHAQASYSIVKCYHELSKRLGLALKVEEQRTTYLSEETMLMARTHDEISTQQQPVERAFDKISEISSLAQALKNIYHDLSTSGLLSATLNQNLTLSFCLPQKAHQLHKKGSMVDPTAIKYCLRSLKPYHGMLLLVDFAELLDCVPPSGARMLLQLVEVYTPLMSLQNMANDADLSLEHVYKLVSHLVYWAKATIIYPLCETNVYVIAPDAPLYTKSHLVEKFSTRFPGMSLFEVIADFSLPTSIGHLTTPLQQPASQGILAQMVLWMLQHHLLMQLHTYVQFMPGPLDTGLNDVRSVGAFHHSMRIGSSELIIESDDREDATNKPPVFLDRCNAKISKVLSRLPYSQSSTSSNLNVNMIEAKSKRLGISSHPISTRDGSIYHSHYNDSFDYTELPGISTDVKMKVINLNGDDENDVESDHEISDGEVNGGSLLSISSPLPVPNTTRRCILEDDYSVCGSNASDNIVAQPSSSHKSNFSITASMSTENCDSLASIEDEEKIKDLLEVFDETARAAIRRIPASMQIDDLSLMVKLYQAGYFKSEHHLEEIMYFENLRRSQLLQLLDKFRDVLIIYETEDPAIASMYTNK